MLIGNSKYIFILFFFSVSIRPHLFVLFKLNDTQVHTKSHSCQLFLLGPLVLFDYIVLALQPFLPECLPSKKTGGDPKIQSPVDVLVFFMGFSFVSKQWIHCVRCRNWLLVTVIRKLLKIILNVLKNKYKIGNCPL